MVALTDQAIEKIKELIISGEFVAGKSCPRNRCSRNSWGCRATRSARPYEH